MTTGNQTDTLKTAAIALGAVALGKFLWRKMNEYDFRGKTVLITGGSRGLGLVLAREFARNGARVAICARDEEELEQAAGDLRGRGADVMAVKCDVTNMPEVELMMSRVREQFRKIRARQQRWHDSGWTTRSHESRRLRTRDEGALLGSAQYDPCGAAGDA